MKRIMLPVLGLLLILALPTEGQNAEQQLLLRISNLRGGLGLSPYVWNAQLAGAAADHAGWMARTGVGSHRQSDGSLASDRARRYGYAGQRVHENYFLGADGGIESAWRFWLNSAPHYKNLTSSTLSEIGIGRASAGGRTATVLVFGHDAARGGPGTSGSAGGAAASANAGQPAYILGLDAAGNIRHEVQPGHTIGDIALIYGYAWDDIPAMLALNDMTSADIRLLQPGNVFLVPPKAGTYTPTSPAPADTATAAATPIRTTAEPSHTPTASQPAPRPTSAATRPLHIAEPLTALATPAARDVRRDGDMESTIQLLLLGAAILVQVGLIGGAALELLRRSR